MTTEKIFNSGALSGTINASSNLVGGNINTFTKETDPTVPDYIKEISKEDIAGWDNNAVVNEEQNKSLVDLETYLDAITSKNTASGELIHITDALNLPIFKNKVDGNVKQETLEGTNYFNASIIVANGIEVIDNGKTIKMPISDKQGYTGTLQLLKVLCPNLKVGDEPYLYFTRSLGTKRNNFIYLGGTDELWYNETKKAITQEMLDGGVALYGNYATNNEETTQCILTDLRIVKEKDATWEKFTNNQQTPNPDNPQEIEVVEGYNEFNSFIATKLGGQIGELQIEKDGTFVVSGNAGSNNYFGLEETLGELCPGLKDGDNAYLNLETTSTVKIIYFGESWRHNELKTITQKMLDTRVVIYGGYNQTDKIKVQVSKTPNKPYLPYGCVGYKVNGKNIWNSDFEVAEYNNDGNKISSYVWVLNKIPIRVKPNTTYTISQKEHPIQYRFIYFNDDTFLSILHVTRNDNGLSDYTFTTPENCNKIYVQFRSTIELIATGTYNMTTTSISEPQLELGSKTDYEPYKEKIVYLDLKGNWVGKINDDVKDYLVTDKKRLYLVKNVTKIVLDNNVVLGNVLSMTNSPDYIYTYTSMFDSQIIDGSNSYQLKSICDSLQWENGLLVSSTVTQDVFSITEGSSKVRLAIKKSRLISEDKIGVQTYLGENPITIFTTNKKTEIYDLGELPEPIKTFKGVNNIQLLANIPTEIEVKYALDVKKYADDRYLELTNALVSTGANL